MEAGGELMGYSIGWDARTNALLWRRSCEQIAAGFAGARRARAEREAGK